ncbi:MAG: endolytic transglycosylase MltG, partial [Chloroflexi bacterium]|nr:endolytic transglycosylase MltG [Chloroflexota bacterium]
MNFRNLLRLLFFMVAISAVALMGLVGFGYVSDQFQPATALGRGEETVAVSVGSPEEVALGLYLRLRQSELNTPVSDDDTTVPFTVEMGDTAATVAVRLEDLGLVRDASLFSLYVRVNHLDSTLEAGEYRLQPSMTVPELAEALQHGRERDLLVTIPEGWRMEEIGELLESRGIVTSAAAFEAVARRQAVPDLASDYAYLAGLPATAGLEGFLFPDTYRFAQDADPADVVRQMLNRFGSQYTADVQAAALGRSSFEVVTVASIVEREAVVAEDRPVIAAVYLNRL